jgi:hypothetical protein
MIEIPMKIIPEIEAGIKQVAAEIGLPEEKVRETYKYIYLTIMMKKLELGNIIDLSIMEDNCRMLMERLS